MSLPPIFGEDENPFRLPSDDKIFRMREEERKRKEETRSANMNLKVWEKNKSEQFSRTQRLQDLVGDLAVAKATDAVKMDDENIKMTVPRRQEKETMPEFIAKKREMFLVQMSLDTKREEIRKLEEKAQMKEEALYRSEQMLEEDAMRFDAFLKENDKKAHDAIKRAEEETKRKQEKTQEIKRLTQQIQTLSSEMSKHREALEDCMRYKKFLDMLTPPEWFKQHARSHEEKKEAMRVAKHGKKMKEWDGLRRRLMDQHRKEVEAKKEMKKDRHRRAHTVVEEEEEDDSEAKVTVPPAPKLEDEVVDLPEEEPPMYFSRPHQLMDIFAALEEQNLFLIQNSQETEHTLEELQHDFRDTKVTMETRTGLLQLQIDELQQQISGEEQRAKVLHAKRLAAVEAGDSASGAAVGGVAGKFGSSSSQSDQTQQEKEKLLGELNTKVRMVYEQTVVDASSKPNTLFMLSQLESTLEDLLIQIEKMPIDYVIKAEKEKEKRRRERKREEQQALQERLQEERNKRAIERSMQAPLKRIGRQVMYRSKPIRKEQKDDGDDSNEKDNNDELRFLS
mmetsp:Transcript_34526/g.32899  ORF Transcript_34526/g.32899 Transcript_34526/m.32899 type:complete len:564 (-) Transcript_34526:109-1800(-)|eukprot:CAMPEP_0119034964 /NCGR_PEP_ID=MMETSP1177-20130426/1966_1 /TAXON_ID=2985 /ORGANISM="Ochromonas sp, Strain CCMP1899" /LENGTH=563 /DNA_ID=CAMNT_0006992807 /DNA_START=113 /DNA_END=1804 /DNA_ORIENTATION=+